MVVNSLRESEEKILVIILRFYEILQMSREYVYRVDRYDPSQ